MAGLSSLLKIITWINFLKINSALFSFYNNFHHGYFVLYQTNDTNYEVQTVHQRCENNASCICAVFVRSMNDVMSFDMCRRKGTTKPKSIQFSTFVSGNLTIGTKVYSRDKGMRYEVSMIFYSLNIDETNNKPPTS